MCLMARSGNRNGTVESAIRHVLDGDGDGNEIAAGGVRAAEPGKCLLRPLVGLSG